MSRATLRLLGLVSLAAVSGCASDSTGAGEVLVVSQVDVQPPGAGLVIGTTQQFTATPKTASGIPVPNRQVVWSSANESIATVSNAGLVTAVGLGEVTISARVDGATGSRPVNVTPKPVAQILVDPNSAGILVGQTVQLEVETLDADGEPLTGRTIQYSSDDPAVASVSLSGLVTGIGPGTTLVRAAAEGKEATSSITVAARPAAKLGFTAQPANGTAGQVLGTVSVAFQDETGGTVIGANGPVTIALEGPPSGAALGGTLTVNAVAGIASFSTLTLNKSGTGYALRASSGSLTPAISAGFTIQAAAAAALAIAIQPATGSQNGAALNPQPVVDIRDAYGNAVAQAGVPVTAELVGGGTLGGTLTVNTSGGGAATFTNLTLSGGAGSYRIRFNAPNLTSVTSGTITVAASRVAIATQPSAVAVSGVALSQQPAVQLVDAGGSPIAQAGVVVTAQLVGTGAALSGGPTATTSGTGLATFSGLTITGKIGSYQLSFGGSGLTPATSNPITLAAGPAARLAFATTPPSTGHTSLPLSPAPAIQIEDASGNPVALGGRGISAVLATSPSGGSSGLSGANANTNAAGLATFSNLAINGPLGSYTIRFQSSGLAPVTSGPVVMLAGAPARITIVTQPPAAAQNGVAWSATPVVLVEDDDDNPVPGIGVTVSRSSGSSTGQVGGTLTQTTGSDGRASFPALSLSGLVGDYRIRFSSGAINSSNSREIELSAGPPARVGIVIQPSATVANDRPFPTQPSIQVQDAGGNPVAAAGVTITAAIASGGGTLGNGSATTNSNGRAVFSGLKITGGIGTRTLQFSGGSLTPAVSNSINVVPGIATRIVIFTPPPSAITGGQIIVPNPVVDLEDVSGNNVDSAGVVITVSQNGSGSLLGTLNRATASNGRATFSDLRFSGEAGTRTLAFNRTGLQGAVSSSIAVTAPPSQLVVVTQPPGTARSGLPLSPSPVVQARDAGGGPVSNVTINVALVEGGSLSGTVSGVSDASGNVSFQGLTISGTVGTKTLRFSTPVSGVPSVNASPVALAAGPASQLSMVTQPGTPATNGVDLSPQPVVRLLDAQGNAVDFAGTSVTASLVQGSGTLNGTTTVVTNASGQAVYAGLDITGQAPGPFVIQFSASGLASVQSASILLSSGTAGSISVGTQPPASVASGASFTPTAVVLDGSGNPVTGATVTVSLASGSGSLGGTLNRTTNSSGVATFTGLTVNGTAGSSFRLQFQTGSHTVLSQSFTLTVGAPTAITILTQPSSEADDNEEFDRQPVVELRDSGNNRVSGVTVTAQLVPQGLATGSLNGDQTVVTVAGVATYTDLRINRTSSILLGNDYRIRFSAAGLIALSNTIEVD